LREGITSIAAKIGKNFSIWHWGSSWLLKKMVFLAKFLLYIRIPKVISQSKKTAKTMEDAYPSALLT
jgi:uncharacterized membrane protein YobD (UPF0266 family)